MESVYSQGIATYLVVSPVVTPSMSRPGGNGSIDRCTASQAVAASSVGSVAADGVFSRRPPDPSLALPGVLMPPDRRSDPPAPAAFHCRLWLPWGPRSGSSPSNSSADQPS